MKKIFVLAHSLARRNAMRYVADAPDGYVVTVTEPKRSLEQNARLWAMLTDVSEQVEWYGKKLAAEDWKHVFSASLRKLQVVPNLDGSGFVALGLSTSQMSRAQLSELMELISAFAADRGVTFSEPAFEPA